MKFAKTILLIVVLIGLKPAMLSSQNSIFNYSDSKYYFLLNGQLTDLRNLKPVQNSPALQGEISYLAQDKLLCVKERGVVNYYYNSGKLKCTYPTGNNNDSWHYPQADISPNFRSALFVRENDLWSAKVNLENGKRFNEKKLTELGVFGSGINILHWYENNVLLSINEETYLLNIDNGNISKKEELTQKSYKYSSSQDGRYLLVIRNAKPDIIYDMLELKAIRIKSDIQVYDHYCYFWIDNTTVIVYNGDSSIFSQGLTQEPESFIKLNIEDGSTTTLFRLSKTDYVVAPSWGFKLYGSRSKNISPSKEFILIPKVGENSYPNPVINKILLYNLKTGQEFDPKLLFNQGSYAPEDRFIFEWTSNNNIIFRRDGDITTQGTWIYFVKTNERKKISSFLADKIIAFPDLSKMIFVANGHIFEVDANGENLKQLTTQQINYPKIQEFNPKIINSAWNKMLIEEPIINNKTTPTVDKTGNPKLVGYVKTLQGSSLRLRSEPSEKASILLQIPNGSQVTIIGEDNRTVTVNGESGKWLKVTYDGAVGWAWGKFIERN